MLFSKKPCVRNQQCTIVYVIQKLTESKLFLCTVLYMQLHVRGVIETLVSFSDTEKSMDFK